MLFGVDILFAVGIAVVAFTCGIGVSRMVDQPIIHPRLLEASQQLGELHRAKEAHENAEAAVAKKLEIYLDTIKRLFGSP